MVDHKQLQLQFAAVQSHIVRDDPQDEMRVTVFSSADPSEQIPGVAVLAALYGGQQCTLDFRLRLVAAGTCRIEVHGLATRLQKAVLVLDVDGRVLTCGEEIQTVDVRLDRGELIVRLTFVPHRSTVEWIYFFARDVTPSDGPLFSIAGICFAHSHTEPPALRRRHKAARQVGAVFAACQVMTILNGCFHLQVEICKPGHKLVGLGLKSRHDVAHIRWWTWHPERFSTDPGELAPQRSEHPIASPALMDAFGPGLANEGHAISGIFANWRDVERMSINDSDELRDMVLTARFDDSDQVDLPLLTLIEFMPADDALSIVIAKYLEPCITPEAPLPILLEVGGRGDASAHVRKRLSPYWDYRAVDYKRGPNVDLVGDAHRLSEVLPMASVQVVFSAEVMEHLLSPLRFVIEANRVLRLGGLFIARMPTTWPLHAEPWDFWRISRHGWASILNHNTGFQILESHESDNAAIVPFLPQVSGSTRMATAPAPMETVVVARKICTPHSDTSGWSPDLELGDYDHA